MIHSRLGSLAPFVVCLLGLSTLDVSLAVEPEVAEYKLIERKLPPPGNVVSYPDLVRLVGECEETKKALAPLASKEDAAALLPDVEIYTKAVSLAISCDEFYKPSDLEQARKLLDTARQRGAELASGKPAWPARRGTLVRGYRSAIDDSVQPYGLVIPAELDLTKQVSLYVWLHGRGDKSTDLHFIAERETKPGQIQPKDGIVLHVFGRHCIGFKSTGEIDIFEAIADVSKKYSIDPDRIALMGFSMGGAGAWHIGAHYTDRFAVIHPGAGFAETRRYLNLAEDALPPWYEQTLWHNYDVPDYVRNLLNVPVIAYSGENDKQKQAADVMEAALAEQGAKLKHLIGPGMGHAYHPETLKEVMRLVDERILSGRPVNPRQVHLQTRTLRYARRYWVEVRELIEHWQDTRVDAEIIFEPEPGVIVQTRNVRRFKLYVPTAGNVGRVVYTIDGQKLTSGYGKPFIEFVLRNKWEVVKTDDQQQAAFVKRPGLQGPIDDVLLEPFLVVTPSGKSAHPQIDHWVEFEQKHFLDRWRAVYRGEARVKQDKDVTAEDLAKYHVILWGDPSSNLVLQRLADKLPIRWSADKIQAGEQSFEAAHHVPLLIYPNPLSPERYVVLNSGCTHREGHDRTNSLQNPKLPDWAVIDVRTPPSDTLPGKVVATDFFDEAWQLRPPRTIPARSASQ